MNDGPLYDRYTIDVTHKDGQPVPDDKRYFVLDLSTPDELDLAGLHAYAAACRRTGYPQLADEITAQLPPDDRPTVVCLCGSTRFFTTFMRANYEETMAGRIVLSVGFYPHSQDQAHGEQVGCTPEQKEALDQLHMRKIDLADEILVLNVGGYIGDSTRREIAYAQANGKRVRWLEPVE